MKVLLSAYACEPGKGSEPEVGLQTLLAAARRHDVWVITRENNLTGLRTYLADHPLSSRITVIGLDVPGRLLRSKKRHRAFAQLYYDQWQRAVAHRAAELDAQVRFDVVHHATFAAYWKRTGVAALRRPLVWGPVGGGVTTPIPLLGELGLRGIAEEVGRRTIRPLVAGLPASRLPQRRAAVVLTQNAETAGRIRSRYEPTVAPNALSVHVPKLAVPGTRQRTVVSVARLVPWKGVGLALRAFAMTRCGDTRMIVIGRGAELPRIRRLADTLGVADRVTFTGQVPRQEVLHTVATASVLVHAALHEEAGFAVSEALSYGTPVTCVDRGGPPELLAHWPAVRSCAVPPRNPTLTVRALARAMNEVLAEDPPEIAVHDPSPRPYHDIILDAYDTAVRRG